MIIKCGREEIDLNNNDEVFYNGACYQIKTRKCGTLPVIATNKAKKLIKDGILIEVKRKFAYTMNSGKDVIYIWYKLNDRA